MYLILQQPEPDDYVLATGKTTEIREFVKKCCIELGCNIEFSGTGLDEVGILNSIEETKLIHWFKKSNITEQHQELIINRLKEKSGNAIIAIDKRYFRPAEVDILLGDATKAKNKLGWRPEKTLDDLIIDMLTYDIEKSYRELVLKECGFEVPGSCGV